MPYGVSHFTNEGTGARAEEPDRTVRALKQKIIIFGNKDCLTLSPGGVNFVSEFAFGFACIFPSKLFYLCCCLAAPGLTGSKKRDGNATARAGGRARTPSLFFVRRERFIQRPASFFILSPWCMPRHAKSDVFAASCNIIPRPFSCRCRCTFSFVRRRQTCRDALCCAVLFCTQPGRRAWSSTRRGERRKEASAPPRRAMFDG